MAGSHALGLASGSFTAPRLVLARLAICFVIVSVAFQYLFRIRPDPYKCRSVLHTGSWSGPKPRRPYSRWSPDSCKLHEYSRGEVSDCFSGRRAVFVGDSWVRQLYWAAASRLDHHRQGVAILDFYLLGDKKTDLFFEAEGVQLEFIWDPWLNSTNLAEQLDRFHQVPEPVGPDARRMDSPALLVVGTPGLWASRNGGDSYMELFRDGVDQILPHLTDDLDTVLMSQPILPGPSSNWLPNQLLLLPVPVPNYRRLTAERRKVMTPDKIDAMNSYLRMRPAPAQTHMPWAFGKMVEGSPGAYNEDGFHVGKDVRERAIDVLLNARCNPGLEKDPPRTANLGCISHDGPGLVQIAILLAGLAVTAVALLLKRDGTAPAATTAASLAPLALASLVSYVAENSHAFVKTDLLWDETAFRATLAAFCAASLASVRYFDEQAGPSDGGPTRPVPREHSDEFKGWLQVAVLLLSYFDGDSTLFTHKVLRLVGAGYIFLSAYGHTTYLLATRDYSLRRVAAVLLRLNLLSTLLALTLSGPWSTYYFAPLISAWFLATYLVLAVGKGANDDPAALLAKLAAGALLVSLVVFPAGLVGRAVDLVNALSGSSWDGAAIDEELARDCLTPFVGMLAASLAHRANLLLSPAPQTPEPGPRSRAARLLDALILGASGATLLRVGRFRVGALAAFNVALFASLTTILLSNLVIKYEDTYEVFHPYISFLPFLAGIHLRSRLPVLRSTYLALPSSVGRFALETHVLHRHVWLAGGATVSLALWPPPHGATAAEPLAAALHLAQSAALAALLFCLASGAHAATRAAVDLLLGPAPPSAEERAERGEKPAVGGPGAVLGDVRVRVGLIVVVLWVGNLLSGL